MSTYFGRRQMLGYGLVLRSELLELGRISPQAHPSGQKCKPKPSPKETQIVGNFLCFIWYILFTLPTSAVSEDSKVARDTGEHQHPALGSTCTCLFALFCCNLSVLLHLFVCSHATMCKWRLEDNLLELVLFP